MTRCFYSACVAVFILSSACSAGELQSGADCQSYRFEGDVDIQVQDRFVKTINMLLEHRAPDVLTSMRLNLHGVDSIDLGVSIEEAHIAAYFRPLENGQVECQLIESSENSRCYMVLPDLSMQVAAVFRMEDDLNVASIMEDLGDWVRAEALDCE
ncbi:hypothetical protein J2T60_000270 [Natronospira proteinivora]|uniref:DUF302 domain-containing protein n=1 Tax=Natronospira proteinivora TaxID=1807133 RepID=A0ABT1G4T8_9GAMM|nr:hypothetical protein [Natronospira proteinivora]MCP1726305.1 hypothetical protein [Natronospira proteinivora]